MKIVTGPVGELQKQLDEDWTEHLPREQTGWGQWGNQTSKDVHYHKSQTTAAYLVVNSVE